MNDILGVKFKKTVLLIALFLTLVFLLIFSSLIYNTQNSNFQKRINNFEITSKHSVDYTIKITTKDFFLIQNAISTDPIVKQLFKDGKREELYALLKDKWLLWTKMEPHFKTMLFHNPDGTVLLRMHKPDKYSDNLNSIRPMVKTVHKEKKVLVGYETGKYATVYRMITPIFDNGVYIGSIDFGINPNHFVEELFDLSSTKATLFIKEDNLKLFKRESSFSINNYILQTKVNKEVSDLLKALPKDYDFTKHQIIKVDDLYYSVYAHPMYDYKNNQRAALLLFDNYTNVINENNKFNFILFITSLLFFILMYYLLNYSFNKLLKLLKNMHDENSYKLEEEHKSTLFHKNFLNTVLDTSNNIVISTVGTELLFSANKKFFEFTNCSSVDDFSNKYDCVSDIFESTDDLDYLVKDRDGIHWINYIYNNPTKILKVKIKKDNKEHIFFVNAKKMSFDDSERNVFSFTDITEIVNFQELVNQKDKLLFKQSKMASMGEMISMIAHQWRQPLSAISTSIMTLEMNIHLDKYQDQVFLESFNDINEYVQYMSKTIDDFRNFYKPNKQKEEVILNDVLNSSLSILKSSLALNNIEYIIKCETLEPIVTFKNELIQVILNLVKNAQDVLVESKIENPLLTLSIIKHDTNQVIIIADNGTGIPETIIDKIFEPYFSTKDEKNGTGLGLYMSKLIIEDHCGGTMEVENDDGAKFIITLPMESKVL